MNEAIDRQERQLIAFLHTKGYNHFSIPQLTLGEINSLVEQQNFESREMERKQRLNSLRRRTTKRG